MSDQTSTLSYVAAINDFHAARRRAALEEIMARLSGRSADLLSYEEVRQKLRAREGARQELVDVPLEAIVGSVGRYRDFTRSFLPRLHDGTRWARVKMAVASLPGLPPIRLYRLGDVYFVQDGHHRVSVAREMGATHIQAYVTEVHSKVPLSPEVQPDDLILKAEYAGFLERTRLDELRPQADLSLTVPGQYEVLEEHIAVHRYFMGLEQQREIPYTEAVAHWYDQVYLPVVEVIRRRGILRDFPGRTEADLYLWLAEHRAALQKELGWEVRPAAAADDLAARFSSAPRRVLARLREGLVDAVLPDELAGGPEAGQWREERLSSEHGDRLFADVLVAFSGQEAGWLALGVALELARREGARVQGLHVLPAEGAEPAPAQAMQAEFRRRCQEAGVEGHLALEVGEVPRRICERSPWVDLLVLSLSYPPAPQPMARLGSGLSTVIRSCPRPVLAVPPVPSLLSRALLAYDGSPKAREALFVAAYLAGRWHIPLVVLTVIEGGRTSADTLAQARRYLDEHDVAASFVQESGPVAEAILKSADEQGSDLIIMGGYGFSPVLEVVLGSAVDQVLRASRRPLLICR